MNLFLLFQVPNTCNTQFDTQYTSSQFDEARNEWLDDKHVSTISVSSEPKGRPIRSKKAKGRGKRKVKNW